MIVQMNKYIIALSLLLFSAQVFCQSTQLDFQKRDSTVAEDTKLKVTIGNLNNYVRPYLILTTVDAIKQQKNIIAPKGYTLMDATVYFSGAGFHNVIATNVWGMMSYIDSCRSGSFISFDDVRLKNNKTGQIVHAESSTYIFDIKDAHLPNKDQSTFHFLRNTYYFKGDIYFSGTNFPNVYIIHVAASPPSQYQSVFAKVKAGTIITFENVVYKDEDGSLSKPVSKTIKVDDALIDDTVIY
jgi:hypothetical protein